jgi:tRNA pseudouridine38-40 synthase
MEAAAALLVGEHDYSAFRSAQCQAASPVKHMRSISVVRRGAYWRFDFDGSAFLHHMVRNIVGTLVYMGKGKHPPAWVNELLASKERSKAAPTFGPEGLYLEKVEYESRWGLPR